MYKTSQIQIITDKFSIGLSFLCLAHCMALPLLLVLIPSTALMSLDNEIFHTIMILTIIPISLLALFRGCNKHKQYYLLQLGAIALTCLILAVIIDEAFLGELGEKALTFIGSTLIAYCHYKNMRLFT